MNRCMLDLETIGLEPGCVIASIGAVKFTDELGFTFYRSIDIESCTNAGLEIDADTLKWWLSQPDETRKQLRGGRDLADCLTEFSSFYHGCDEIWANSPAFDCTILKAAYAAVDQQIPWHYSEERCYRTLKNLPGFKRADHDGVEHNALDDAKNQARDVIETL